MNSKNVLWALCGLIIACSLLQGARVYASNHAFSNQSAEFGSALQLFTSKNYEQSRRAFFELVKRHPKNNVYWFNLANSYFMLGQYRNAVVCYNHVIRSKDGLKIASQWYRARAFYKLGDRKKALSELRYILRHEAPPPAVRLGVEEDLRTQFGGGVIERAHSAGETRLEFEALKLYQRHEFRQALAAVDRIKYPSKHDLILKSLILKKMNRLSESRRILKSINSQEAKNLLDEVEMAQTSRRKFWGYINASLGQESNVYQVPAFQSPTSRTISDDFWGLGGELKSWGKRYLLLNYYGNLYDVFSISALQIISHRLWLSYGFKKSGWNMQIGPYYELDDWGGQSAYDVFGIKYKTFRYKNHFQWGATADFGSQSASQARYSYMSGAVTSLRFYAGYIKNSIFAQVYLLGEHDGIGDIKFTNGDVLPEGQNNYGIGGWGIIRINNKWMAIGRIQVINRNFIDHAVPNKVRADSEAKYEVRAIRTFTNRFSGYLSLSETDNSSTLGSNDVVDLNYTDQIFLLGVSWSNL